MECTVKHEPIAARLFKAHGTALRAYLVSRVRDTALADDLCQEIFVVALARGVPETGAGRWLFGIARNKVLSHFRDRKPAAGVGDRAAQVAGPLEVLSREERMQSVRAAVRGLDEDLREAILLRYEGGLDYAAIADRLDVPVSTIQGRLKRARRALKTALGEEQQ
ncbi:MAG: sigma-70 family RNA polymerase sigma factor [Gemmatimonadales bacterium]|jgi:RNA polymerase sigma-70 factor (ECF subfamily)|nr:sigma-70 family RNA polymerase sigma factor [Gemmatimonadales bacterium]